MATQAGTIVKTTMAFQFMVPGTVYSVQLQPFPVLDAKGLNIGSFGDRVFNFDRIGKLMFTTEVSTEAAVNAAGEYYIDYTNGIFIGQPAAPGYCRVSYQSKEVAQP